MKNIYDTATIEYRDYTTNGRFIQKQAILTSDKLVADDVDCLLDFANMELLSKVMRLRGLIDETETVKRLWRTNVVVRGEDGRFLPYKHIL